MAGAQTPIRRHQLREIVPLADSTIYEMEQRGDFPRRFALTPRCVVWDLSEVEAWSPARRAKPVSRAQGPDVKQRRTRPVTGKDPVRAAASRRRERNDSVPRAVTWTYIPSRSATL